MRRQVVVSLFFLLTSIAVFGDTEPIAREREQGYLQLGLSSEADFPSFYTGTITIGYNLIDGVLIGLDHGYSKKKEARIDENDRIQSISEFVDFVVSAPVRKDSDTYINTSGEYRKRGAYLRYFTGKTFNILFAFHEKEYDARVTGIDDGETEFEADLYAQASVFTLGIGNQWIKSYDRILVHFGCDWIVYHFLYNSSIDFDNASEYPTSEYPTEYSESKKDKYGEYINKWWNSSFGIFAFTIGLSF